MNLKPLVVGLLAVLVVQLKAQQLFPSAGQLTVTITAAVTGSSGSELDFAYGLSNASNSTQSAIQVFLKYDEWLGVEASSALTAWHPNSHISGSNLAGWTTFGDLLRPGGNVTGLRLRATSLPGIIDGYVVGFLPLSQLPQVPDGAASDDDPSASVVNNSAHMRVLGPVPLPSAETFDPIAFLQTIVQMTSEGAQLGWFANAGIPTSILAKLTAALNSLQRGSAKAAANQLNALLNEVRAQSGKQLSSNAVALLSFNVQYLVTKIS